MVISTSCRCVCVRVMSHGGESPETVTSSATSGKTRESVSSVCLLSHSCYFRSRENMFSLLLLFSVSASRPFFCSPPHWHASTRLASAFVDLSAPPLTININKTKPNIWHWTCLWFCTNNKWCQIVILPPACFKLNIKRWKQHLCHSECCWSRTLLTVINQQALTCFSFCWRAALCRQNLQLFDICSQVIHELLYTHPEGLSSSPGAQGLNCVNMYIISVILICLISINTVYKGFKLAPLSQLQRKRWRHQLQEASCLLDTECFKS